MYQHDKLPTVEELFSKIHNAKYFKKSDASSSYWLIKVDEESSKVITFLIPFSKLRFKRLPNGIHSAIEVFEQERK